MTSLRGAVLALSTAVVLVLVLVPRRADAFCRTTTAAVPPSYDAARNGCITEGLVLYWKGACVTYAVEQSGATSIPFEDASRVIDEAFATWSGVTCPSTGAKVGIEVANLGPVECTEVRYNSGSPNQNLIVFRESSWPYSDSANTLGLTTITYNAENGEMYDADMEINATGGNLSITDRVPANGFDLLSVVTHEAGHFLGLAHATSNTATMFASYKPGTTTLRSLTEDDALGLCSIYPDAQSRAVDTQVASTGFLAADPCNFTPRHGFTTRCEELEDDPGGCATAPGGARGLRRGRGAASPQATRVGVSVGTCGDASIHREEPSRG
jgi:hypothetical protein